MSLSLAPIMDSGTTVKNYYAIKTKGKKMNFEFHFSDHVPGSYSVSGRLGYNSFKLNVLIANFKCIICIATFQWWTLNTLPNEIETFIRYNET